MTFKRNILKFTALLSCLLLSSCLKEDMADCPEQIRVYFSFTTRTRAITDGIDPNDVDRMNLYVFDKNNLFVAEYEDEIIENFSQDYCMDLSDLIPGKYRIIAWGGKDPDHYSHDQFIKKRTTLEEVLLKLSHIDGYVKNDPHHLFFAELTSATVTNDKVQRFDMSLFQHTNRINIRTQGLPANSNTYSFTITDDNSVFKFDNSFASELDALTYTNLCEKTVTGQLFSGLTVMKLDNHKRTARIQIKDETTGTILYPQGDQPDDLVGLILNAYSNDVDFNLMSNFDLLISFYGNSETGFTVKIKVNGWDVKEDDHTLFP